MFSAAVSTPIPQTDMKEDMKMKKVYNTPELNMICVQTVDVITLSAGEGGTMRSWSFGDIVGGGAGWIESDSGF